MEIINQKWNHKNNILFLFIAPTYFIYRIVKNKFCEKIESKCELTDFVNILYLSISSVITMIIFFFNNSISKSIIYIFLIYSFSRINDLFIAFFIDAKEKLNEESKHIEGTRYSRKIELAVKSYFSLIIDYSSIYYILNNILSDGNTFFDKYFNSILDSLYFSAATITSLGDSTIEIKNILIKGLSIYEVFFGMVIVIFNIVIYMNVKKE